MSIEEDLRAQLTLALKAKDLRTANIIRMIITKVMERRTAKGFTGKVDDELHKDVIGAYRKSLEKARDEFAAGGAKGAAHIAELDFEIGFCQKFLPAQLGADAIAEAVREAVAELGADPKLAGRIVGAVMKKHKGEVDAGEVKKVVDRVLAGG